MDDSKVIVLKLFVPAGGSSREFLRGLPIGEVLVVSFDDERFLGPYQVQPPVFYCF